MHPTNHEELVKLEKTETHMAPDAQLLLEAERGAYITRRTGKTNV
jgi:hypothetical protein